MRLVGSFKRHKPLNMVYMKILTTTTIETVVSVSLQYPISNLLPCLSIISKLL
jgi:hypothetical protein